MSDIGIITTPSDDESFAEPVNRFLSIMSPIATNLHLFAGGFVKENSSISEGEIVDVGDGDYTGIPSLDYFFFQLIVCYYILRHHNKIDLLYFHKGAMGLVLPVITARIVGTKTCVIKIGAFHKNRVVEQSIGSIIVTAAQYLSFQVADGVVVFTENEVETVPNEDVYVGFSNYCDLERFKIQSSFENRTFDIGFAGRFNDVKGVAQMAEAATKLVETNPNLKIRLVGDGPLYEQIERQVDSLDRITLTGWVDHDEIVTEYNQMQVLFAPSKAEGLPTGLIEAMGCGVVVVATPVGSIDELISHGKTGFHLPNRNPTAIKRIYEKIHDRDDLPAIGKQARDYVVGKYTKQIARERFKAITESIIDERSG